MAFTDQRGRALGGFADAYLEHVQLLGDLVMEVLEHLGLLLEVAEYLLGTARQLGQVLCLQLHPGLRLLRLHLPPAHMNHQGR
jgi:hypothetical protein